MEDSDAEDITTESLFKQFEVTKKKTNESHVMQYGDLVCSKLNLNGKKDVYLEYFRL
jgi:legumain